MKNLVISDIHNNVKTADYIISAVDHDRVVFLGDYFDSWGDYEDDAYDTALWLKNRMDEHPEDIFLAGNHDIPYMWGVVECSGFTKNKKLAIQSAVGSVQTIRKRLVLYTLVDEWLLTHAGLTNGLHPATDVTILLAKEVRACMDKLEVGESHYLIEAGKDRGGWRNKGGITWCDYRKFEPIPSVKQLFGHTRSDVVRSNRDSWCIDTNLNHYAIINDGVLSVHAVSDLEGGGC